MSSLLASEPMLKVQGNYGDFELRAFVSPDNVRVTMQVMLQPLSTTRNGLSGEQLAFALLSTLRSVFKVQITGEGDSYLDLILTKDRE